MKFSHDALVSRIVEDGEAILLSPAEVATKYKIPKSTQAKMRMRGDFCEYVKFGRSVRYIKADVDKFLAQRRRRHTSDPGPAAS